MKARSVTVLVLATAGFAFAQAPTGPYVPGVTYATTNPNYLNPNPLYFEGKITWELLKIDQPSNFWEYLQRGIHYQDDMENTPLAIADYQKALAGNSLQNGTCQLITSATLTAATASGAGSPNSLPAKLNPPACMFTIRLRLGYLLRDTDPQTAIQLFNEVLQIDPLRLDVNALIGDTYVAMAGAATAAADQQAALQNAVAAYKAELALSPVTPQYTALTGDTANNAHVHWSLADVYRQLGDTTNMKNELGLYLQATQWHSDTYPWRIQLAQKMMSQAGQLRKGHRPKGESGSDR